MHTSPPIKSWAALEGYMAQLGIRVEYDSRDLKQWLTRDSTAAIKMAEAKAINGALRKTRTESGRRVRAERKLKAKFVRESLPIIPATSSKSAVLKAKSIAGRMKVGGKPVPLSQYGAKQSKRGVSVNVSGQRRMVKGAFMSKMRSGHTGVYRRRGAGRLPVDELFSTRVVDVFENSGFTEGVHSFAQEHFSREFGRLADLELTRALRRR